MDIQGGSFLVRRTLFNLRKEILFQYMKVKVEWWCNLYPGKAYSAFMTVYEKTWQKVSNNGLTYCWNLLDSIEEASEESYLAAVAVMREFPNLNLTLETILGIGRE